MWPFTKHYSILDSGFLSGGTDWHCHILPGVDDGIRTMESALEVLSYYESIGIREVWLTPHIMEDVPNEPESLRTRFGELCAEYDGPINLHLAAENMIDTLFDRRFADDILLKMVRHSASSEPGSSGAPDARSTVPAIPGPDGDMLLVETSYFSPPMAFDDTLDDIRQKGLHPLLAHPERYVYMSRRDYDRHKDNGVLFQLNLMSLVGMYGQEAAGRASRLLLDGMYDYAGSDLHRLAPWQNAIADRCLDKKQIAALQALRERMDHPDR